MGIKIKLKPLVVMAVIILSMVMRPSVAQALKINIFFFFCEVCAGGESLLYRWGSWRGCWGGVKKT